MEGDIPMRVRSNYSIGPGTLVTAPDTGVAEMEARADQLMTGIAHMSEVTQIQVEIKEDVNYHQSQVFKAMAEARISVDFINISPSTVVYTSPHTLNADRTTAV